MLRKGILALIFALAPCLCFSQDASSFADSFSLKDKWVDAVFKKLSRRERISQLFMIRVYSNKGEFFEDSVAQFIRKERIGSLLFFQGGPGRQAILTNRYQSISKVPLFIAMDGECGLGMRLDSTISYPYQMTLGAIQDHALIYEMGRQIALDFKHLGMHINFSPVVDINNNPKNPVIGYRSFGDDKYNVTGKALAYLKGLQDGGLLVSLKHFPGHGDTRVDSHIDLPRLPFDRKHLDSLELYPFRELLAKQASGVMIGHIQVPALDTTSNLPASLSPRIITDLLKNEWGFKGLVFSDAMEMKGVTKFFPDGEADVRAVIAGNDVIELSENTKRAIKLVRRAIRRKRISWDQINASTKKILAAKYQVGLHQLQPIRDTAIANYLNRPDALALNQRLGDAAVTILRSDSLIKAFDFKKRTAIISLGITSSTTFQSTLKSTFENVAAFIVPKNVSAIDISAVKNQLNTFEQIIVAIHDTRRRPWSTLDYSDHLKLFVADLSKMNSIISVFANPYTLADLSGIEQCKSVLMNYQQSEEIQKASARVIMRQLCANGKLSVTVNPSFKYGDGIIQD